MIGPEFTDEERFAIIEYLKIHRDLPETPPDYQPPELPSHSVSYENHDPGLLPVDVRGIACRRYRQAGGDPGARRRAGVAPRSTSDRRVVPQGGSGWSRARKAALDAWHQKNDERIKAVDARVAEVVPLLKLPLADGDPLQAVHMQIEMMLLESTFASKSPEETKALCKAEADPARPRWNDTGMPHIQQSLAALYDWRRLSKK